jgi:hypothetical protein
LQVPKTTSSKNIVKEEIAPPPRETSADPFGVMASVRKFELQDPETKKHQPTPATPPVSKTYIFTSTFKSSLA